MGNCICHVVDEKYWTTHYGAVEPGSMMEPNPDCRVHFPDVYATVINHRGMIIGKTWFGTRLVASPRAHRILSEVPLIRQLPILRLRYLGRS